MEAPTPFNEPRVKNSESLLFTFNSTFKNDNFIFNLYDINNSKIKISANKNTNDIMLSRYESEIYLDELKKKNKYFKMFDNYEEFKNNFMDLCKANNVNIINFDDNEMNICIDVKLMSDNLVYINLKREKIGQKEQIDFLLKDSKIKDQKIEELNNKVLSLEKIIQKLLVKVENLEKNKENSDQISYEIKTDLYGSKIFNDKKEISFLFNGISKNNNKIGLKLLFSSEVDGENEEKLKATYVKKNDLLFLIKTKENKRFGGYAHESFELSEFRKKDSRAFLFNIDNLKLYKSQNSDFSIFKNRNTINSINFGGGTDLRIYHKFFSNQNYTKPNGKKYYDYNNEKYALNGKKNYDISILEIFQVLIE